jgi:hypothetical protein
MLLTCALPAWLPRNLPADKREEYDEPDFALIDTLFSLAEAHLFMQARRGHLLLLTPCHLKLYCPCHASCLCSLLPGGSGLPIAHLPEHGPAG